MFALWRARLRMDHHVGWNNFADALFDGIAQGMDLLEARCPRNANGGVHEVAVAGPAHAHAVHVQHAVHASDVLGDFLLQSFWRNIQESIQGTFPEPRAYPENYGGYGQSREGIGIVQPRHTPGLAGPDQPDACDDDERAPYVGGKMQRIGFQRVTGI